MIFLNLALIFPAAPDELVPGQHGIQQNAETPDVTGCIISLPH